MTPYNPYQRPKRTDWTKPALSLDTTSTDLGYVSPHPKVPGPVKPPAPENPVTPKPPYPENPVPPKPPYPENPIPPKPPYPEAPGNSVAPVVPPNTANVPQVPNQGMGVGVPGGSYLGMDFMRQVTPEELVANQLSGLLDSNSQYMRNARQRGLETANSRGLLNSSMAAGNAQRSALEAAMPIAAADADVYRTANEGNFQALNQLRQMRTAADLDNWLSSESYNRDFNGRLAMMPIQNSMDMMAYIQQRALEDPSVYTPEVISGINNFWNQNMFNVLSNYFGTVGGGGP